MKRLFSSLIQVKRPLFCVAFLSFVSGLSFFGSLVFWDSQAVQFESSESMTAHETPVFNRVQLLQSKGKDIWLMNQSHHGVNAQAQEWDRLAIVVDRTQAPMTARFYQFEAGSLDVDLLETLPETRFKVSCFVCHNNGPRAIRPVFASQVSPVLFRDQVKILFWNLRIHLYGRIKPHPSHDEKDASLNVPFRYKGKVENETLQVKACLRCHREEGFLSRGLLHRQQSTTIAHMVRTGQMPPAGFSFSPAEKRELEAFLKGF